MKKQKKDWGGFGQWVKFQRELLGLNQRQCAAALMIQATTLSKIETGNACGVSSDLLVRMAKLFSVAESEVFCCAGRLPDAVEKFVAERLFETIFRDGDSFCLIEIPKTMITEEKVNEFTKDC